MNGFRSPGQLTHREQQDAFNAHLTETIGSFTRVLKGHELKILDLERRIAGLEAAHGPYVEAPAAVAGAIDEPGYGAGI